MFVNHLFLYRDSAAFLSALAPAEAPLLMRAVGCTEWNGRGATPSGAQVHSWRCARLLVPERLRRSHCAGSDPTWARALYFLSGPYPGPPTIPHKTQESAGCKRGQPPPSLRPSRSKAREAASTSQSLARGLTRPGQAQGRVDSGIRTRQPPQRRLAEPGGPEGPVR